MTGTELISSSKEKRNRDSFFDKTMTIKQLFINASKLIIIFFILNSCAAVGTRTIYKVDKAINLKNLGFTKLDWDTTLNQIQPKTEELYCLTMKEAFNKNELINGKEINASLSFDNVSRERIVEQCVKNNLDGIIITRLKFIHVTYSVYYAPIMQNFDTEVEMKLYNNMGELQISTTHNTYSGNSYMMPPPVERTIHDGTMGAFKRIIKEMSR
ncbi:MAG: hypothetical protein N4A49_01020 [Marinifilaceae bacterium]|jgi:hypothetical protein|nr:hypothetical protein [Marinifilaceae bacterium]